MVTFERPNPRLGTEGDVVGERVVAFLIDLIGWGLLVGILSEIVSVVSTALGFIVGAVGTLLFVAYFVYFEAEYGQTVGKMVLDVVVVTEDGEPITYEASAIRTVLRVVDGFPYPLHVVAVGAILLTDRQQRLGDLAAGTVVVEAEEKMGRL